jgi:fluoride exporter
VRGGGSRGHGVPPGHGHLHGHADPSPVVGAVDPDVDLHVPGQRAETAGRHGLVVVGAVAAGGALGAVARHALELWLPGRGAAGFPWGIFAVNVSGCALIGVLMVLIGEGGREARAPALLRPFLGVGVLGGFTTFSTYAVDAARLLRAGDGTALTGAVYVAGTLLAALAAVWAGASATRAVVVRR